MTVTLIILNAVCAALNFALFVFGKNDRLSNLGMGLFNSSVVVALLVLP